jgi:hypothetical protein
MAELPSRLRIWVALDESPRSSAALTAAAALAAELDAELAGLFVEDVNLQHLIGLPFAREFSVLTGEGRSLSQGDVERTWRREAAALQRLLAGAAEPLRVRWSFRVTRGRVSAEVKTLAQALDLVVLGGRTGISVRAVTRTATPGPGSRERGPVLALVDARSDPAPSLNLAALLARRNAAELVLLVSAADDDAYRANCDAALRTLGKRASPARCVWLRQPDRSHLIQAVRRERAGCLVLPDREHYLSQAGFEGVLDEIDCPIVLTR